ncbi:MAG: OmpA family protein [Prochloraceae cyanobacterium]|nr:OmpA family protein [Prochloraceae cyanobacterium]
MNDLPEKTADLEAPATDKLDTLLDLLVELTTTEENQLSSSNSHKEIVQSDRDLPIKNYSIDNNFQESHLSNLYKSIDELRELQLQSEKKINDSIDTFNTLLPLIKELITIKTEYNKELIIKTIVPIIDEIIKQKFLQNSQRMGAAIAPILPEAISQKIDLSPGEIAKAIAPEIAVSIQEQIKIDRDSISKTIGPEMGKAIKAQIELEKDTMIDALYPIIGSTISKYMAEVVSSINDKVENALSIEGFKRKIWAKIKGVSEAELILAEATDFEVKAVFLINKTSGLVMAEVQPESEQKLESEMLGGMLTAIRSFVNDCILQAEENTELNEIEYSGSKIILEVAGYCYLAILVKGDPSKKFIREMREVFSEIVISHGKEISEFDGDRETISPEIEAQLKTLVQTNKTKKKSHPPTTIIIILIVTIATIISPLVYIYWRNRIAHTIEFNAAIALESEPELSIYRLIPEVKNGKLIVSGKVPSDRLRQQAIKTLQNIAVEENLTLENKILAVKIPPDLAITKQEVQTLSSILNFQEGLNIYTKFNEKTGTVEIEGSIANNLSIEQIITTYKQIPGVNVVVSKLKINIPTITTRIYFNSDSAELIPKDIDTKIKQVKDLLDRYPKLHLRIIGHGDRKGKLSDNQELAIKRAISTGEALKSLGADPKRIHISGRSKLDSDTLSDRPSWLNRYVSFETFIPSTVIE